VGSLVATAAARFVTAYGQNLMAAVTRRPTAHALSAPKARAHVRACSRLGDSLSRRGVAASRPAGRVAGRDYGTVRGEPAG
jgi:hypothetical protein